MRVQALGAALGRVGLQHIVNLDDNSSKTWYPDIVSRSESTTQIYSRKYQVSGFGQAGGVNEGTTIPEDELFTGNQKDYTPVKRGLGFSISTEASESDQYGALNSIGGKLKDAFRRTKEQQAANVVNNATSASFLGPDLKALAATDHPLDSGTDSNLLTSAVFGPLALEDLVESMMVQKGHRGDPDPRVGPFYLYCHPSIAAYARRVTESPLLAGTANNDINDYLKEGVVKVVSSPYFTSTTFFAIRSAKNSEHGLFILSRRGIRVKSEEDIDKDAMKYRATEMYVCSFDDWRGYAHNAGL